MKSHDWQMLLQFPKKDEDERSEIWINSLPGLGLHMNNYSQAVTLKLKQFDFAGFHSILGFSQRMKWKS